MHTSTAWSSARSDETPSVELLAAASERRVARIGFDLHEGTRATVADDGPGFDVEEALACAVRDGRVGLMGMMERVRLLGGTCEIESRPGGPTTISAFVPAWRPPEPARP